MLHDEPERESASIREELVEIVYSQEIASPRPSEEEPVSSAALWLRGRACHEPWAVGLTRCRGFPVREMQACRMMSQKAPVLRPVRDSKYQHRLVVRTWR